MNNKQLIQTAKEIYIANKSDRYYSEIKKAQKLSKTIIQQNFTIGRLKKYKQENKL